MTTDRKSTNASNKSHNITGNHYDFLLTCTRHGNSLTTVHVTLNNNKKQPFHKRDVISFYFFKHSFHFT